MDETNNELWTYTPNNVDVETTIRKIFTSLGIRDNHHNIFDDIKNENWFYWWFYVNNCNGKMKMERTVRVINCRMKVLYECWNASGFIPFMDVAEANKYLLETNEVDRQVIRFSQTRPDQDSLLFPNSKRTIAKKDMFLTIAVVLTNTVINL